MTYSPDHVTDDHRLTDLLDTLIQDVSDLRQMLLIFGDAMELPRRRPPADRSGGRQATHGPSRPTEDLALDESRGQMRTAVAHGVTRIARATALVRGTTAEMDRALGEWEGETVQGIAGGVYGVSNGAAGDRDAA